MGRLYFPESSPVRLVTLVLCVVLAADARAQSLPTEPISVGNGRVVFGGEFFGTFGSEDPGFFDYNDYEYNALRNVRLSVSTEVRASRHLQALAELRLEHGDQLSAYAIFLRIRPWPDRRFDLQVGRVPPTFGAFTKTLYAYNNIVIGQPLAYQYLLSLRTTALPRTSDDLLRMRGRGWLSDFPVGDPSPDAGIPIMNTLRYDTGVQVHGVVHRIEWTGAVTAGSLSDPRLGDNNGRPQYAGRVIAHAVPGLNLGVSAARGPWLDDALDTPLEGVADANDFMQTAVALDAEISHGSWLARAEWLRSSWSMPALGLPAITAPVVARSLIVEGRYRLWPGLSVALRGDGLWFSDIAGTSVVDTWEANVRRLEGALAYSIHRNITAKFAVQRNRRDGGRVRHDTLLAGQLVYWF
jgi:hypothetical protein